MVPSAETQLSTAEGGGGSGGTRVLDNTVAEGSEDLSLRPEEQDQLVKVTGECTVYKLAGYVRSGRVWLV